MSPETEVKLHQKHMQMAYDRLAKIFPNFKFRGYLMDIDGKCVELHVNGGHKLHSHDAKEDSFLANLRH
jgi:hypothetical protein